MDYWPLGVAVVVLVDVSEVELLLPIAGVEAGAVILFVVLELLECEPLAGAAGFTTVVLFSVFEAGEAPGAGATVSVFCSHAARSAALARIQMYFFIGFLGGLFAAKV